MNELTVKYLEKLMMRSVSARYALLYKVGVTHRTCSHLNLEHTPNVVVAILTGPNGIKYWEGSEAGDEILKRLLAEPLPEGIPDN